MSVRERVPFPRVSLPAAAGIAGVFAWWLLTTPLGVPAFLLPSPAAVVERLASNPSLYLRHAGYTLSKVLFGGAVGAGSGFLLGLAVAYSPLLRRSVYPYIVTVRVLPTLAIAPLLLLYLGTGYRTAVVFVGLISFFPMVVNTAAGLQRVGERELDLLRSVDAASFRASLAVRLPYALPDLLAGAKQTVTLSVVGAIVAEWVVGSRGLGYLVLLGTENVQLDLVLAALVVLIAAGLCLFGAVGLVGRRIAWLGEL